MRVQILIFFFALHKTPFSDFLMQFECIEKHIFSGISDYFRPFSHRRSHTTERAECNKQAYLWTIQPLFRIAWELQ